MGGDAVEVAPSPVVSLVREHGIAGSEAMLDRLDPSGPCGGPRRLRGGVPKVQERCCALARAIMDRVQPAEEAA